MTRNFPYLGMTNELGPASSRFWTARTAHASQMK
jgi:hypothetical protein